MVSMNLFDLYELKCRLLLDGVAVDDLGRGRWKERVEHLYQHDGGSGPAFLYPQELILRRGNDPSLATSVNVRFNARSPWRLGKDEVGSHYLSGPGIQQLVVDLVPRPAYYDRRTESGADLSTIVQHLGVDALGVIPNNYCSYFADGDQCKFCEIEPSYRTVGSYPTMRKSTPTIVEAVNLAMAEPGIRHLIMTAGNLRSNNRTAEYYRDILDGLEDGRSARTYRYGSIMAPEDHDLIAVLHGAGMDGIGFNLEFFDPDQFVRLAPGKNKYGRDRLLDALVAATESFGVGHVYTNMVYGIQTWQERGRPIDFAAETAMCLEAVDDLLSRGVIPLFTLYHTSNKNQIGPVVMDADSVIEFNLEIARRVLAARILPPGRTGILFNVGTIGNSVYNDALAAVREERYV
jgi:hypothetical protein